MPNTQRILRIAHREGLTDLQLREQQLITDLCCRAAGAKVRPFDPRDRQLIDDAADYAQAKLDILVQRGRLLRSEPEDWDPYDEMLWDMEAQLNDCSDDLMEFANEFMEFERSVHQLLEEFDLSRIPGRNELERAARLIKLLRVMTYMNQHETYPIIPDAFTAMTEAFGRLETLGDQLPSTDDENAEFRVVMFVLELIVKQVDLPEMLRIARHLDTVEGLVRPEVEPRPDPDGDDVILRPLRSLGELGRVLPSAWTLPRRWMLYQAFNGELDIREPVASREKKQLLYLLLDGTGSMQGAEAGRAAGAVLHWLEAVKRGEAVLYLRFFDSKLGEQEHYADSPESADELIEVVTDPFRYIGASTRFDIPLAQTAVRVRELISAGQLQDEEVVIITDGLAPVPELETLEGIKLHSVQVGSREVLELSELARASGGVNLYLPAEEVGKE